MKNKALLIVIAIVVIIGLWAFSGYNGMVDKQEAATTALSNVEAQYQRRADMMPQLVKIVKAYAKHEKETFEGIANAKTRYMSATTPEEKMEANNQLSGFLGRLFAISEAYPELKAKPGGTGLLSINSCSGSLPRVESK